MVQAAGRVPETAGCLQRCPGSKETAAAAVPDPASIGWSTATACLQDSDRTTAATGCHIRLHGRTTGCIQAANIRCVHLYNPAEVSVLHTATTANNNATATATAVSAILPAATTTTTAAI